MTDNITLPRSVVEQALEAHQALRDWVHAVPQTVVLPAMPGVDGDWLDDVESTLRAALEQPDVRIRTSVPEGWKLMPFTLTDTQRQAAQDAWWNACDGEMYWEKIYAVMLAAAPQPPVVEPPQTVTDCHQSQQRVEQEPVAWQRRMRTKWMRDGEWWSWQECSKEVAYDYKQAPVIDDWEYESRPLYTHPQPKREPLTEEAERQCPYPKANPSTRDAWLDGWEAAEREHGIGGEA